eukprot:UN03288
MDTTIIDVKLAHPNIIIIIIIKKSTLLNIYSLNAFYLSIYTHVKLLTLMRLNNMVYIKISFNHLVSLISLPSNFSKNKKTFFLYF